MVISTINIMYEFYYFLSVSFRFSKIALIMITMNNDENDTFPINEKEVMDYYGYSGCFWKIQDENEIFTRLDSTFHSIFFTTIKFYSFNAKN